MSRVTITLSDDLFNKIDDIRQKKRLSSAAQCIRELIELALRIEEVSKNSAAAKDKASEELKAILEVKELLKNNMIWSMEARFLSRALISNTPSLDRNQANEIFEKCKSKATAHVIFA